MHGSCAPDKLRPIPGSGWHRWLSVAALAACSVAQASEQAADSAELRLSGYGTVGLVRASTTQPWGYRRDSTQPATSPDDPHSAADSRIAVQANWRPAEQWEGVAQAVVRRRGGDARARQSIEWAFVSYRPLPDVNIRVGRTSPDMFLLADHRNVGFAYPWVRPPVEFYGWMPVYSTDGADIAATWQQGDATWRVKAFAGKSRMVLAATAGYPDMDLKGRYLAGGSVSREAEGLTLKLSVAKGRYAVVGAPILNDLKAGLALARELPVPSVAEDAARLASITPYDDFSIRYAALGAAWDNRGPVVLQGELARLGGSLLSNNGWHGYFSAGLRAGRWTLFGMAGRTRPTSAEEPYPGWGAVLDPVIGPGAAALFDQVGAGAAQAHNLTRRDQRSTTLGVRWDATTRLSIKAQFERVSVFANGSALWADSTEAPARSRVVSVAFDFIF